MVDARQFLGGPVLAPPDGEVAVEDEGGVRLALPDEPLLPGGTVVAIGVPGRVLRVEPQAPAPRRTPRGVALALDQAGEVVPRVGPERLDDELAHGLHRRSTRGPSSPVSARLEPASNF